jgi:hypothetical protein
MRSLGRLTSALGVVVVLGASCVTFPTLEAGICGNAIVEPDAPSPEDCDTFATEPGTACRGPEEPLACHFDCTKDANGQGSSCPARWACGEDGTCRPPGGGFEVAGEPFAVDAQRLDSADIDGDGRADLVAAGAAVLSVHSFDADARLASSLSLPATTFPPAAGDVSGDGLADLLFPVPGASGVAVLLGGADRSLTPKAYPTISFPATTRGRLLALLSKKSVPTAGSAAPYLLAELGDGLIVARTDPQGATAPQMVATLPGKHALTDLGVAGIAVGRIDENDVLSACPAMAIAFRGEKVVYLYEACVDGMDGTGDWAKADDGLQIVALPLGQTVDRGVSIVDENGDGHLDLIVSTKKNGDTPDLLVTHGQGVLPLPAPPSPPDPPAPPTFTSIPLPGGNAGLVLAVADLDADGLADLVTERGISIRRNVGYYAAVERPPGAESAWTEAVVADLNGDGIQDVLAGSSQEIGVDYYAGVGTLAPHAMVYNHSLVATQSPVQHFAVGDFDGDFVRDVALSQIGASSDGAGDEPSILFGRKNGAPETPVGVGALDRVLQVMPADIPLDPLDAVTDLAVVTENDTVGESVSVLVGSTDRLLLAPFGIQDAAHMTRGRPVRSVVGHFTGDAQPGVATISEAISVDQGPLGSTPFFLWVSPAGDGATIADSVRASAELPLDFDPADVASRQKVGAVIKQSLLAAGDLDGDGVDEIVAVLPLGGGDPEIVIAKTDGEGTPSTVATGTIAGARLPTGREEQLAIVDLDGDGARDLALLADETEQRRLYVFWNDGGAFDFKAPTKLTAPGAKGQGAASILGFAAFAGDVDAPSELALTSGAGVWLVDPTASAPRSFPEPTPIATTMRAKSIAAADLDGDGLADLALADGQQLQILRGLRGAR